MSYFFTDPQSTYDVFLSFRGFDERRGFIAYLRRWLNDAGIYHFYDAEIENAGKEINEKIFPAIRHARVALVVLSENYANSKWCLDELVEMLKCYSESKTPVVIPIFYRVKPADVYSLTNKSKFGKAFQSFRKTQDANKKDDWRKALEMVKGFTGYERDDFREEVDLLDTIVRSIFEKISPVGSINFVKNTVGADRLAKDVISLLKIGEERVRVIGIGGTEGIGKTMVARAVCNGTLKDFDRVVFLDKIGTANDRDLVGLQKKLLKSLIKRNDYAPYDDCHGNIKTIESNLHCKKIILVLDGVTKEEQMGYFGAKKQGLLDRFNPESRILITTEDRNLLKDLKVDDEYIVEGLSRDEAFRLFCRHAFEREEPEGGYEMLSRYLAHYAGGHPSTLEIWAYFLKGRLGLDRWGEISDKLAESQDLNSTRAGFGEIFKEYPSIVVGRCGDRRSSCRWNDENYSGVKEITVGSDSQGIKFITVVYDRNQRAKTITRGTKGGETSTHPIKLDYPGEYLTYMSGHTKEDSGRTIIQSLTFYTNRGKCEAIGTNREGRKFSFPYTGRKIIRFHGSCNGSRLESIGAIYKPIRHTPIGYEGGVFGPFGGAGEKTWESNRINGISVRHADFISEIKFEVPTTSTKPRTTYGENGEEDTYEVKLRDDEWITSFSGYFQNTPDGRILINSLTFRTNKRILGPIGREKGNHFSSRSEAEAMRVTKFFGRTYGSLETIGATVESFYPFESVGLFGCSNASGWHDKDANYTNVRRITVDLARDVVEFIGSDEKKEITFIRSITFHYEMNTGGEQQRRTHPGAPADVVESHTIEIDADEYLTSMSGYYMDGGITSLTFWTTGKNKHFFGHEMGMHFSSPVTGGKIVGFYGNSGKNLEAIGAYFKKISDLYPVKSIGPLRGSSEITRDDWESKGVKELVVKHHEGIHYITFVYDNGREHTYRGRNEGPSLNVTPPVKLNYPQEYLTSISGYTRADGSIKSLTFYSNKSTYGPYGKEEGEYFWYPSNGTRITGFYGGDTLNSIGVYVEPIPHMYPFKTVGPFGGSGGTPWDDGVHSDVRGFRISYGRDGIEAIGIAYDNDGSFVSGSEHGHGYEKKGSFVLGLKPGKKTEVEYPDNKIYTEVLLDYPKERLRRICVWVDEEGNTGPTIVRGLHIFTTSTTQTYGPFGPTASKRDKLRKIHIPPVEEEGGRIVGFFGTANARLNSIGARLESHGN